MKKLLALLLGVAAVLTAAAYWWNRSGPASSVLPRTERIDRGPIIRRLASGQGRFVPARIIPIVTDVPAGKIVAVNPKAEPGQFVQSGEWLIKLDTTQAELTLRRTEAELAAAEWDLEQARLRLLEIETKKNQADAAVRYAEKYLRSVQGASPELETKARGQLELAQEQQKAAELGLKAAQAAVSAAEKKVEAYRVGVAAAQKQLDACTISAPQAGFVLEKRVVVGQLITPQAVPVLMVLADNPRELELMVQVNETDIPQVSEKMEAEFTVDAFAGEDLVFRGRVVRISPTPTPPAGLGGLRLPIGPVESGNIWNLLSGTLSGPVSYTVTVADFQMPPAKEGRMREFKIGMSANVDFVRRIVSENVLRIPNEALSFRPPDLKPDTLEQIRAQETSQRKPVWIWVGNGRGGRMEMRWVTVRPEATDGKYTQLEDAGDLQEGTEVVVELPTPPPRGGLFETPVRIGPN